MTSTVIGPAILCALMVGYPALAKHSAETPNPNTQLSLPVMGLDDCHLKQMVLDLSSWTPTLVSELSQKAQCSVQLCLCEGAMSVTMRRLLVCEQCEHTACEKCAGIPKHLYRDLNQSQIPSRLELHDFENTLKNSLPMRLHLLGLEKLQGSTVTDIEPEIWTIFVDAVKDVGKQELRFYSVKRTHCWTVTYDTSKARLELVLSRFTTQWYVYAKPDSKLAINSKVRQI